MTLVLLHSPHETAATWAGLPGHLSGHPVLTPEIDGEEGHRYVARAAQLIAKAAPEPPLVLVGHRGAGPLLPALAAAQRAARRAVRAYVFLDADLPVTRGEPAVPVPEDWPDAPCGYLLGTAPGSAAYAGTARTAGLRGWPVVQADDGLAKALAGVLLALE